jgi:secondary thiamine-phosphate synthase enzyme
MQTITVNSSAREQMLDITDEVRKIVSASKQSEGICVLFTQHTTCGLTINENADPHVQTDMLGHLQKLIPQHEPAFRHFEQNSDAHIKSTLTGASVTVPFENTKLLLGRWQAIYLCEFDGPRERKILLSIR